MPLEPLSRGHCKGAGRMILIMSRFVRGCTSLVKLAVEGVRAKSDGTAMFYTVFSRRNAFGYLQRYCNYPLDCELEQWRSALGDVPGSELTALLLRQPGKEKRRSGILQHTHTNERNVFKLDKAYPWLTEKLLPTHGRNPVTWGVLKINYPKHTGFFFYNRYSCYRNPHSHYTYGKYILDFLYQYIIKLFLICFGILPFIPQEFI